MAHIVKVPTSATSPRPYEVRWSRYDADGKRHFKKERFRTERDAKAKKREVEDEVASASVPDYAGGKASLLVWGDRWLKHKEALLKPSTFRGYTAIWAASVKPQWGHRRINAITTADIQGWITELLQSGKKPPTIRHHVWVLGQVFAYAARARAITYNPVRDVELPTDRSVGRLPYAPHFLTAEEVEQIAQHLSPPFGTLVRFMAWTGLRTGEVAGLNIGDVDLMRSTLHVRRTRSVRAGVWTTTTPKSGKARSLPLMPWIVDDLKIYLSIRPNATDPNAPLWPGTLRGGAPNFSSPWEAGTFLRRQFRPVVEHLEIGHTRLHDLRHTYASLAASRGVPSAQVAQWMGHASDVITRQVYTHLFDTDSARHAAAMSAGGRPATPTQTPSATVTPIRAAL